MNGSVGDELARGFEAGLELCGEDVVDVLRGWSTRGPSSTRDGLEDLVRFDFDLCRCKASAVESAGNPSIPLGGIIVTGVRSVGQAFWLRGEAISGKLPTRHW